MRIIVFDGVCNLCNNFVDFVITRDKGAHKFTSLQSEAGRALVPHNTGETMYLVIDTPNGQKTYSKSTAALKIISKLSLPWTLLALFLIIPKMIRDPIYSWVARNRYRWFGKRETCRLPTPAEKERFL